MPIRRAQAPVPNMDPLSASGTAEQLMPMIFQALTALPLWLNLPDDPAAVLPATGLSLILIGGLCLRAGRPRRR